MTQDPMRFASPDPEARPLHLLSPEGYDAWRQDAPEQWQSWAEAAGFAARVGQVVILPDGAGRPSAALAGLGSDAERARGRFQLAAARAALKRGTWRLETTLTGDALAEMALGWLFAGYSFQRYAAAPPPAAALVAPVGVDAGRLEAIAAGEALTRDLINTPARDMGPAELEVSARELAEAFGATCAVTTGDALAGGYPLIQAVGQAASAPRAPRLIELRWGGNGPAVTLVGKGVCFDTGGLNLKPGSSMGLMKKDMGGAATVLGLARMIMASGLDLRLRVLIPAVENSVAGDAFRPGDILPSRKGLTVEVNNTDAEGRLVLADALALASEEPTDLLVSMATLTGAARVALGPDVVPFYTDDDSFAGRLAGAATRVGDPLWRMPFWAPYEEMIEPGIADLDNAPSGGFAGSITAALFLRRFAVDAPRYVHFDMYGWTPAPKPGRPKGGTGQGARALFDLLSRGL